MTVSRLVAFAILAGLLMGTAAPSSRASQKTDKRFGVDYDPDNFPQKTAKECLSSVVRAIDRRRVDYLLAQLADPPFVDKRVQSLGGSFPELVKDTTERMAADPAVLKELRRFLAEGDWEEAEDMATVKLKDVKGRAVFLRKVEERWYFENRQKAQEEAKEKEK